MKSQFNFIISIFLLSTQILFAQIHLIPENPSNVQKVEKGGVIPLKGGMQIELEKPFPLRTGTLSAWIRPTSWDGQSSEMVQLFHIQGDKGRWTVFKYRKDKTNYGLIFIYGLPSKEGEERQYVFTTTPIKDWQREEWHHIVATWSEEDGVIALYIDGERKSSVGIRHEWIPQGEMQKMQIARDNIRPDGEMIRTVFDKAVLYDRVLTSQEITALAKDETRAARKVVGALKEVPDAVATIPKISIAPKIDGVLAAGEWDNAAKVFGGLALMKPSIHLGKTFEVYSAYDDERLYLMMVSPTPDMKLRAVMTENGNVQVAADDALEFFFAPTGELADYYQFIGNSLGYYYANHAGDSKWKAGWEFANTLYEGFWYAEFSIPFSAFGLGKAPETGTHWKANFCRDWATESMSVFTTWSFTTDSYYQRMGILIFGGENSGYVLNVNADDLAEGRVNAELRALSPASKKAVVQIENADGVQHHRSQDFSEKRMATFTETLPSGHITNVQIQAENGAFRQSIPLHVGDNVRLTATPDLKANTLKVSATLSEVPEDATIVIKDSTGEVLFEGKAEKEDKGVNTTFDVKDMPEGRYYQIVLESDGKVIAEKTYDHMGKATWRTWEPTFKGVPHPWIPIEYGNGTVGFWGRKYQLGTDIVPVRIEALSQSLTRSAMNLRMTANGQLIKWNTAADWKMKEATEGVYQLVAKTEHWKITATAQMEFDGFWWVDLECEPLRKDSHLDELSLSIPFAPGVAKLFSAHNNAYEFARGELTGDSLERFYPHIWIGNDERGLTWAIESDQYWNAEHRTRFHPDAEGGTLEIRMVDKPLTSGGETLHFGFGLQATPVRPLNPARRSQRIAPTLAANIAHPWALDVKVKRYSEDKEWGFLSPHFSTIESVKAELEKWRAKGMEMPWYVAPDIISPQSTEFQVFRDEWKNPHAVYQFACANTSFAKFTHREMEILIREAGLQAVYVDCAKAYACGNLTHGCGYRDAEGKLHLTWPLRAMRRYLKDLYILLHESGLKSPSLTLHVSGGNSSIAHGFSDIVLEGEDVQYNISKNPSYFDLYPPMMWRAIFGKGLGINTSLLPNYGRVGSNEAQRLSETLNATFMAQALLNDTLLWNLWTHTAYVNKIYAALDGFDWQKPNVQFEPYWEQGIVSIKDTDLKVSIYHTDKGVLLAIGNFTKKPLSGKLSLNLEKFGFAGDGVAMTNLLSGESLSGESPDITVPQENFLLLAVQPKQKHQKQ